MVVKMGEHSRKIKSFWAFFKSISNEVFLNPIDKKLISQLDKEVYKLGKVGWEYGPWNEGFYFCLSPNLKLELLEYVDECIALAPNIPNWSFLVGKPKKEEKVDEFVFMNDTKSIINTTKWRVVVYKFKDGTFDIDIITDLPYEEKTNYLAVDIAITNLLGELNYMKKVSNVSIVKEFDSNTNKEGFHFRFLSEIIK